MKLGPISLPFYLARDEGDSAVKAGVHSGFALSLLLMLFTTDSPLFVTLGLLAEQGNDVSHHRAQPGCLDRHAADLAGPALDGCF